MNLLLKDYWDMGFNWIGLMFPLMQDTKIGLFTYLNLEQATME
jgi:hypothetical protein